MKKSFMTRALATGLSLAMAFSLSAATNVTTAEAASLMKASSKTVTEGKTAKAYMTSSMAKKYRIKSHKESTVAKKYISVAMMSSRKGLKITAKEGALAAANLEKKGVQVKINFVKASSAKAAKKATKIAKTATLKVVVKAKAEEKMTMTAEATGAKQITVTFNKAIADASKVKATVKKGTADRACKATVDGTKIVLAMDAKLVQGTYTVSVEGVDTAAMTADVVVEKDETLTSFKVSSVAAMGRLNDANATVATDSAIITYDALNQYGERMNVSNPQVSCTLGTAAVTKAASATASGEITVTKMPTIMAIQGTKGTVILVDKNSGVNLNAEVTVSTSSTPATLELVGVYNANSNKIEDLRAGDKLDGRYILFTAEDQYGNDFTNEDVFEKVTTVSLAGGLTNVALATGDYVSTRTVDGKDYLAIQLAAGTAAAGTYNLTIVNKEKGMLLNGTYTVSDSVVIKSININADKGLYANKGEQELGYEIVDQNGNSVTSYSVLNDSNLVRFDAGDYATVKFVKNADGTAKLIYDLGLNADVQNAAINRDAENDKENIPTVITVYANPQTSSNLIVKPVTFNINEKKVAKSASKLKADTATVVALGKTLDIAWDKIVYADQYGNEMSAGDAGVDKAEGVTTGAVVATQTSIYAVLTDGMAMTADTANKKFVFAAGNSKAPSATVYVRYGKAATTSNYDFKFTVTAASTTSVDASTLKIDSVKGGNAVSATLNGAGDAYEASITEADIKVVAKIGGVDTVLPSDQYVIKSTKDMSIKLDDYNKGTKSKTATVTIQVTTQDANGNRTETELTKTFQITADSAKIAKVDGVQAAATSGSAIAATGSGLVADDLKAMFKYKDQFGEGFTFVAGAAGSGDVMVSVDIYKLAAGATADDCIIIGSGTKNTKVTFKVAGTYTLSVKAYMLDADGKETSAKDCKVNVTVAADGTTTWTIL